MAKIKYISCDIYKRGIYVFVGTLEELKTWVNKTFTDADEKEFVIMINNIIQINEAASFNYNNKDGQGIIHLYEMPNTPNGYAILNHELLHATFHLLNFCNVEYSIDGSNEAFTYLMEHLTRNALEIESYTNV